MHALRLTRVQMCIDGTMTSDYVYSCDQLYMTLLSLYFVNLCNRTIGYKDSCLRCDGFKALYLSKKKQQYQVTLSQHIIERTRKRQVYQNIHAVLYIKCKLCIMKYISVGIPALAGLEILHRDVILKLFNVMSPPPQRVSSGVTLYIYVFCSGRW